MHTVCGIFHEPFYSSKILNFYFEDLKIGVIDIETTGLNPDRSRFILGGLVVPNFDDKKLLQFFAETKEEEAEILNAYLSELGKLDVLINYNGDGFDLPYLNKRLQHYGLAGIPDTEAGFPICQSFDLYRAIDRYSSLRKLLPNLKQKTVETFMGLWTDRTDEISGAESVELYHRYLKTKNPELRDMILLHNADDLLQLSRLMSILEKLDLHKIMFYNGFVVSQDQKKVYIRKIQTKRDRMIVTGELRNISLDYRSYLPSYEANFSCKEMIFSVSIPWQTKHGVCYIDLTDYPFDCSVFEKYPSFQSGFLLLKDAAETRYGETNHLIKLILKEILKDL